MNNEIKTYIFRIASELDCSTASLAYNPMERFADYPLSLILIYENLDEINKKIGEYDLLDGYGQLQFKLIQFYRLLKENGMINE